MNDVQVSPEEYNRLKLIEEKYNRLCKLGRILSWGMDIPIEPYREMEKEFWDHFEDKEIWWIDIHK